MLSAPLSRTLYLWVAHMRRWTTWSTFLSTRTTIVSSSVSLLTKIFDVRWGTVESNKCAPDHDRIRRYVSITVPHPRPSKAPMHEIRKVCISELKDRITSRQAAWHGEGVQILSEHECFFTVSSFEVFRLIINAVSSSRLYISAFATAHSLKYATDRAGILLVRAIVICPSLGSERWARGKDMIYDIRTWCWRYVSLSVDVIAVLLYW